MKNFLLLVLVFTISTAGAQKKGGYHVQAYKLNSNREHYGYITNLDDSSMTISFKKKTETLLYSELKKIKVFKNTGFRAMYIPAYVGLGFVATSPFKSTWKTGLKTAGIGTAILFASAAIDVSLFMKPVRIIRTPVRGKTSEELKSFMD